MYILFPQPKNVNQISQHVDESRTLNLRPNHRYSEVHIYICACVTKLALAQCDHAPLVEEDWLASDEFGSGPGS